MVSTSLNAYRKEKGLAQKEMAHQLNISGEHYSRLEEGKLNPSKKLLFKINDLTGSRFSSPAECKLTTDLEMCFYCEQLKEKERDAFKIKMMRIIKAIIRFSP